VQVDRLARHDGRNGVFVDQLALPLAAQQDAEIVKPGDDAQELYAVDQKDRHRHLVLAHMVEKCVLKVLFVCGHGHCLCSFLVQACGALARSLPAGQYETRRHGFPPQISTLSDQIALL